MEIKNQQCIEQKQILSTMQTQSLGILSMSNGELNEFLRKEEIENPLFEIKDSKSVEEGYAIVGKWLKNKSVHSGNFASVEKEDKRFDIPQKENNCLKEYIKSQIDFRKLDNNKSKIIDFIIDLLDDNGYLTVSSKEISYLIGCTVSDVISCVEIIRSLEPVGIGASSLSQCLIMQLEAFVQDDEKLVEMVKYHLSDLAAGHYNKIAKALSISTQQAKEYAKIIRTLNPRPTRGFGEICVQYIVPDVVFVFDQKWEIKLNDSWMGEFGISHLYANFAKDELDEKTLQYFKEKLNRARFIIKCTQQRRETLLKVCTVILNRQMEFFAEGKHLKQMNLKQVATELEIHESTVSRAIKGKYLQCQRGTYPLKSFFIGGISDEQGNEGSISRDGVKGEIEKLIEGEDSSAPLSDNTIAVILERNGFKISRRTVAKYREEMGIKNAFERKDC